MAIYSIDEHSPRVPEAGRFWIAPGAHVIGRVALGLDVGIWFGAVLRGDKEPIVLGDRTNIQESATLHTDPGFPMTIGPDCTVGHQAVLHGCTIGPNSLVGMCATVLNGAKIGANCLIGAKALVTEGKVFPDNSLIVGSPAKFVRELTAAEIEGIRNAALDYVGNWRRYVRGLKRLDAGM